MSSRFQVMVIAFMLAAIGLFIVWYKAAFLNIPLTPHEKKDYFTISAEVSFTGDNAPAEITMALPAPQEGVKIISQESESGDFGFTISQTEEGERAVWSKRNIEGKQKIFYKITVSPEAFYSYSPDSGVNAGLSQNYNVDTGTIFALWDEVERAAVSSLIDTVRVHSSGPLTFAAQLIDQLNKEAPSDSVKLLLNMKNEDKISLIMKILMHEKINVRKVRGIYLKDRQKGRTLTEMFEVQTDEGWKLFDYEKGHVYKPKDLFVWQRGNDALFTAKGVSKPRLRFSIIQTQVPVISTIQQNIYGSSEFLNFSLFTLPASQQNAFKQILLIPMGVLIVVILRILVGIRTMGTFMPVLFSLAFIQTSLLNGLVMFFVIVFSGLFIRFYLSRLRLLLVARISAVIIVVIAIMSLMSIISYKLGITQVLSVTFFPMIILSWTIERMSILWEEEGGREVFVQGSGSLIVAVLAYFVMMNEYAAYLFFSFPELLLVILAVIILIGRYTGYRVSELLRFAPLGRS
ncbi:UUP1 family membrane protein [Sulfurovum sp. zt1-1]|uniref:UUP1 family membrane protein n=1 Tax=Sulfurovum zhangzhouensis TaxID=3019067 RepID=A0ABT7QXZ6_9BACT|nr:UUP1 family membrane protein [Sulfurovum zhangzhouensis]MDM5271712.1 UUP1 family membrane protein [Sulfurovum zhangzhouensis]